MQVERGRAETAYIVERTERDGALREAEAMVKAMRSGAQQAKERQRKAEDALSELRAARQSSDKVSLRRESSSSKLLDTLTQFREVV